jgi:hypothetical protein
VQRRVQAAPDEVPRVNGSTITASTPACSISSIFCSSVVSRRGAVSGRSTFLGCGSKV